MPRLASVLPAVPTPFRDDQVDLEAFSAFCGHLLTQEVDGLVVCGTTGEGTALEAVEYAAVVAAADGQAAMLPDAVPATKRVVAPSPGTFSSYKGLLVAFLVGGVLIVGGLAFFPALALCSLAGHLTLRCGLFVGLVVGVALIVGGLAFVPVIIHSPVAGNLAMPAAALS